MYQFTTVAMYVCALELTCKIIRLHFLSLGLTTIPLCRVLLRLTVIELVVISKNKLHGLVCFAQL